jgi:hypothetical protein
MYGIDFEDRLRSAGLRPRRLIPEDLLGAGVIEVMGITPKTPIWVVLGEGNRHSRLSDKRLVSRLERRIRETVTYFGRG